MTFAAAVQPSASAFVPWRRSVRGTGGRPRGQDDEHGGQHARAGAIFLVLILYWLETAVIGFWTILRIAAFPDETLDNFAGDGVRTRWKSLAAALFFTVHSGIFMTVHFLFLWELFSGSWSRQVRGVGAFVDQIILATGLWIPLLVCS